MSTKARAVVINEGTPGKRGRAEVVEGPRDYDAIREILGCDTLDHFTMTLGAHKFNVLVDDSGIIKKRHPVAIGSIGKTWTYGSTWIFGSIWIEPYSDDRKKLTDEEIFAICSHIVTLDNGNKLLVFDTHKEAESDE